MLITNNRNKKHMFIAQLLKGYMVCGTAPSRIFISYFQLQDNPKIIIGETFVS